MKNFGARDRPKARLRGRHFQKNPSQNVSDPRCYFFNNSFYISLYYRYTSPTQLWIRIQKLCGSGSVFGIRIKLGPNSMFFDPQHRNIQCHHRIIFIYRYILMQVQRKNGMNDNSSFEACLDENIWEFEWKRLEKHSRKILAPVILLGKLCV